MTLRARDCVGKWVRFTQVEYGSEAGYIDKALVVSPNQVYLNTKDNPRCREYTGYINKDDMPEWSNYGWWMDEDSYKDLQLLEDIGKL
jgi:hypothetical protein